MIPSEILKIVVNTHIGNTVRHGKGDPNTPHRPLCMLDIAGKLYEKMLRQRTLSSVSKAGGLSLRQYGFTTGRSSVDAIIEVIGTA